MSPADTRTEKVNLVEAISKSIRSGVPTVLVGNGRHVAAGTREPSKMRDAVTPRPSSMSDREMRRGLDGVSVADDSPDRTRVLVAEEDEVALTDAIRVETPENRLLISSSEVLLLRCISSGLQIDRSSLFLDTSR